MLRLSSRRHRNKFAALLEEAPERTQKGCGSPRGGTERLKLVPGSQRRGTGGKRLSSRRHRNGYRRVPGSQRRGTGGKR